MSKKEREEVKEKCSNKRTRRKEKGVKISTSHVDTTVTSVSGVSEARKVERQIEGEIGTDQGEAVFSFGARFLSKLGWKDGEGLGANKEGLVAPIAVQVRKENLGVGADTSKAADWNSWWTDVYNKNAASSTKISRSESESDSSSDTDSASSDDLGATPTRKTLCKASKSEESVFDLSGAELLSICAGDKRTRIKCP